MRCLLFSLLIGAGCAAEYKGLIAVPIDPNCVEKIQPRGINTTWFDAGVDVMGKHISGLMLIKNMPDSSTRVVFTNEAGVKFFDFEFSGDKSFKVHHVIPQLNKNAVIGLLREDFELMLGVPFRSAELQSWERGEEHFFGAAQKKETAYFITSWDCASLLRQEIGSARKRKVSLTSFGDLRQPDSVRLQHHTFNMQIVLKRLVRE
ncbi:MAG: hypothetical protein ACOYXT_05940 [Bacteroidota bacterium]